MTAADRSAASAEVEWHVIQDRDSRTRSCRSSQRAEDGEVSGLECSLSWTAWAVYILPPIIGRFSQVSDKRTVAAPQV